MAQCKRVLFCRRNNQQNNFIPSNMWKIRQAQKSDIQYVSELFDLYRQFYFQQSDNKGALKFMSERIEKRDSIIFVADSESGIPVSFVQLYPIYTSVGMKRSWLLNDLFVREEFRQKGVAKELIEHCKMFATETNAAGLLLETSKSNVEGNALYAHTGFQLMDEVNFYFWKNKE